MTDVENVLTLTIGTNDAGAQTVGGFLAALLRTLWLQGESFDPKRPFGNSDWDSPVVDALENADLDDGDLVDAIESLSRDPGLAEMLAGDILAAGSLAESVLAASLIEKGWHK